MKFIQNRKIYSSMSDADACLSPVGLFQIVEDALTELMGELKVDGLTSKRLYNAFWVFTKNRIELYKKPCWNDDIKVESFISSHSLVKLNIDTALKDAQGNLIAYSRTELCALDLETKRIRKVATVGISDDLECETPIVNIAFSKIGDENLSLLEKVQVRSTNIDFCHHTNNIEYLRFLLATYSVDEISRSFKEIQVDYINQSFENEELEIYKSTKDNVDSFVIRRGDTDIVKCEICR